MSTTAPEARVAVSWVNEISGWVMPRDRARGYRQSRATQERVAEIVQEHIDPKSTTPRLLGADGLGEIVGRFLPQSKSVDNRVRHVAGVVSQMRRSTAT